MPEPVRLTLPVTRILAALLDDPDEPRYGLDLMAATGLPSGTLYPILTRLHAAGWLRTEWEDIDPSAAGRPAAATTCSPPTASSPPANNWPSSTTSSAPPPGPANPAPPPTGRRHERHHAPGPSGHHRRRPATGRGAALAGRAERRHGPRVGRRGARAAPRRHGGRGSRATRQLRFAFSLAVSRPATGAGPRAAANVAGPGGA
ncbi:PadR family transcriptional regulator [Luedemannella flava]